MKSNRKFTKTIICDDCEGEGRVKINYTPHKTTEECSCCKGSGRVRMSVQIKYSPYENGGGK